MAKLSIEELIAAFKELSLVEVSEFVKAFEEEFDVYRCSSRCSCSRRRWRRRRCEEKSEFDVILESAATRRSP